VLLALVTACLGQQPRPPSVAEARAFLNDIVDTASSRDFEGLCALGGGSCTSLLTDPGGRAVPPDRPTLVGIRPGDSQTSGPRPRTGGYILELCGLGAGGEPYYSEMLVFRDYAGELRAIEPLYWIGITIVDGDSVGHDPGAPVDERCRAKAELPQPGLAIPGGSARRRPRTTRHRRL
jgi:hypothetical protein